MSVLVLQKKVLNRHAMNSCIPMRRVSVYMDGSTIMLINTVKGRFRFFAKKFGILCLNCVFLFDLRH